MYKGIIFDLDGTLLNTIEDITDSLNKALKESSFNTYSSDEVKYFVGSGVYTLIERALKKYPYTKDQFDKVKLDYMDTYFLLQRNKTKPYDNILELLEKLKKINFKIAVLSNKPHNDTMEVIKYYFGLEKFDLILGQRENIPIKPNPTSIFEILQTFKLDKKDVLYVGDSDVDMLTALNAELDSVGVTWGFRTKEELIDSKAKYIVNDSSEILNICLGK